MTIENTRKTLRDRAKEFGVQLPFMEQRQKGDIKELIGQTRTIVDYGFVNVKPNPGEAATATRECAAFIVKEFPMLFFFGGTVLTDQLQQLEAEGYHEEILAEGLPMLLTEKRSRNGRNYVNVEFYPE